MPEMKQIPLDRLTFVRWDGGTFKTPPEQLEVAKKAQMNDGRKGLSMRDLNIYESAHGASFETKALRARVGEASERSPIADRIGLLPVVGPILRTLTAVLVGTAIDGGGSYNPMGRSHIG